MRRCGGIERPRCSSSAHIALSRDFGLSACRIWRRCWCMHGASSPKRAMSDSAHARYRERLEALTSDEVVLAAVNAAAVEWSSEWGWDHRGRWTRTYGRFDPDGQPYALIVFSSRDNPAALCRVEVF